MKNSNQSGEPTGEQTTLFSLVGSPNHASRTASQENEKAQKILDISGRKCLEQFESAGRPSLWAKMFLGLLIGQEGWYSSRCALTWKVKGTKYNRLYCQLAVSTPRTGEIGSGLLPTVTTQEPETECEMTESGRRITTDGTDSHSLNLGRMAKMGLIKTPTKMDGEVTSKLFPTPKAREAPDAPSERNRNTPSMEAQAKMGMLPTPAMRDYKGGNSMEHLTRKDKSEGNSHQDQLPNAIKLQTGQTGQLSPHFVLEMMGFPPDWTELPFLSGETNQSKPEEMQ